MGWRLSAPQPPAPTNFPRERLGQGRSWQLTGTSARPSPILPPVLLALVDRMHSRSVDFGCQLLILLPLRRRYARAGETRPNLNDHTTTLPYHHRYSSTGAADDRT